MKEILQAMSATNALFEQEVIAKGNFGVLKQIYTANARILPPGADMVSGRDGIIAFWSTAVPAMGITGGKLSTVEATQAGDGVVEIGIAQLETKGGPAAGKYVVYWKQEDGRWKWDVDIWNMNA